MIAYRFAAYATPLRTIPDPGGARFHRGGEREPTQYLSLHPLGPWAELMRGHDLRTREQVLAVRMRTWALRVDLGGLPEIAFDGAPEHGIDPSALVADDQDACRALADRLRAAGAPGMIVPSAALPGTRNAVLFGARVASPYLAEPAGAVDVPSSVTADDGRPLAGLLDRVRFRGDRHAALDAWARGEPFVFAEPDRAL